MLTWFQVFTLADDRKLLFEWGYSNSEVIIESITDEETNESLEVGNIPQTDLDRFNELVLMLDPFPPHEPYEP